MQKQSNPIGSSAARCVEQKLGFDWWAQEGPLRRATCDIVIDETVNVAVLLLSGKDMPERDTGPSIEKGVLVHNLRSNWRRMGRERGRV